MDVDKELKHDFWRRATTSPTCPEPPPPTLPPGTKKPHENALRHICFTSAWSDGNSSLETSQTGKSRLLLIEPEL